jgi:hypothetical protein
MAAAAGGAGGAGGAGAGGAEAGAAEKPKKGPPFFGLHSSKFIERNTERYLNADEDDRFYVIKYLLHESAAKEGRYFKTPITGFIKNQSDNKYKPEDDDTAKGITNYKELHKYFFDYLIKNTEPERHESIGILGNAASLNNESRLILEHLIKVSAKGYITVDSQPGLIIDEHVYQIPYLQIMLPVEKLSAVLDNLSRHDSYIRIIKGSINNKPVELGRYIRLPEDVKEKIITITFGIDIEDIFNYPNDLIPELYNDNFFKGIEMLLPDNRMVGGKRQKRRKSKKINRKSKRRHTLRTAVFPAIMDRRAHM